MFAVFAGFAEALHCSVGVQRAWFGLVRGVRVGLWFESNLIEGGYVWV